MLTAVRQAAGRVRQRVGGTAVRAGIALVAALALVGGVVGLRDASTTRQDDTAAAPLPPVAVDGSTASDAVRSVAQAQVLLPRSSGTTPLTQAGAAATAAPTGGSATDAYAAWAGRLSSVVGIQARALQAYGAAQVRVDAQDPGCHLSWATLAGIANIESQHGTFGGRTLEADGRPSSPIIGIPLDGGPDVRAIADTDGGRLDGDTRWDRAVGPFQFIPSTWARSGADGDGDGTADPQDIDDAALAAGQYLCAGGADLSTGRGWSRAILGYNASTSYLQSVYDGADAYARRAATAG